MAPPQKPGSSKQDYGTPRELLEALKNRLHIKRFWCDLAATKENAVALQYYTEQDDALQQCWNSEECEFFIPKFGVGEWGFCNPPFAHLAPWVQKAWQEAELGAFIAMLLPASVGSNWWRDWVHDKAHVLLLNGRVQFVGADGLYPKDTVIALYTPHSHGGYEIYDWRV